MRRFLKKIAFYAIVVLVYFVITGLYNYTYDPYGILGNRKEFVGIRPNEHSLKVQHILENPNRFNSFLFSNSKGGALHFNQLDTTDENWYNMTYSLGTPEEFYTDILLFLENNVDIKNVVVGLDDGAIYERASTHENQASRKFVSLKDGAMNWEYLFLPISLKKLHGFDLDKKHIVHDIFENGNYYAKNAYDANCERTEKLTLKDYPSEESRPTINFSSQLNWLKKIKQLSVEKNINLVFVVHPTSYNNYRKSTNRLIQLNKLIIALQKENVPLLQPFGNKLVQNNACYWLDRHHYSKKIGDSIVQCYTTFRKLNFKN